VARCTALAAALSHYGPVVVVVEHGGEAWNARLQDAGIAVMPETDLVERNFAGVVLDDYGLRLRDVARWRERTKGPVVQIEDRGAPLSGIDLVINATPGLDGRTIGDVPALLGPQFAMLAAPYAGRPRPRIGAQVDCVVVGVGWNDANGVTEQVLAALARVLEPATRVEVMLGATSPNIGRVADVVNRQPRWRLHRDAAEPWHLLDEADMAISGAGQSLLERLAFGIPTLAIAVADNQAPALLGAAKVGAVDSLGGLEDLSEGRIASAFTALAGDAERRSVMSAAAQRLVDGHGAARVACRVAEMANSSAHLRSEGSCREGT
jgi:spore coat polysaccharide biosynthesis predicted glycosyltransferase SpsG